MRECSVHSLKISSCNNLQFKFYLLKHPLLSCLGHRKLFSVSHLAAIFEQLAVEALEKLSLDLMLQKLYGCVGNATVSSDRAGSGFHKE